MQSFLSLGRFHLPLFGLLAAAGLMAAMALSLYTSRRAGVDSNKLWDLGVFTVLVAFVLTRALLVVGDFRVFLQYPILVLELPSLTRPGVAATIVLAFFYLRRLGLPMLRTADALAPCVALLAAFLYLGQAAGGTREGVPTSLPWGVQSPFGHVHPVEVYAALTWLVLCVVLLVILQRQHREGSEGYTIAWGLMLGGLAFFLLEFFHLPGQLYGSTRMDGYQPRALVMMVAGAVLLAWRYAVEDRAARRLRL